jgi:hypothetical protein
MKMIDSPQFKPLSLSDIIGILDLTIKEDNNNKVITFLCMVSAYTEDSQFNISNNAPSATGKSYIPLETAQYFPEKDIISLGYCSPAAFFHDVGEWDKEKKMYIIDLSRKILIFLDQPHTELLGRLRPLLSHDKKEISLKITDKTQKYGFKTKNVLLRGYPSVIFCTVGLRIDEQEATRFFLLSPESSQEKLTEAIRSKIKREIDVKAYQHDLEDNPNRKSLKKRILAIRNEKINDIIIKSPQKIKEVFLNNNRFLKPRHSRDVGRVISIIKSLALLNLWFRERNDSTIIANEGDVQDGLKLWSDISETQELNLPPYIYELHHNVILPAWNEKKKYSESEGGGGVIQGLLRNEIIKKHIDVYRRNLPDWQLRQQILPMLENAGLINQEPDPHDRRKMWIYPTPPLTISPFEDSRE